MKGFIEATSKISNKKVSINISRISWFTDFEIAIATENVGGNYQPNCMMRLSESYDEIKRKIEESQTFDPFYLQTTWNRQFINPNTEGDQLG